MNMFKERRINLIESLIQAQLLFCMELGFNTEMQTVPMLSGKIQTFGI